MADYDITLTPVKRASFDAGRKIKFWTSATGATPAVVKDQAGATLAQPVKVPANGHLGLRFAQWPVYYSDNAWGWKRIKQVPGMPATIAGLPVECARVIAIGIGGNLNGAVVAGDVDNAAKIAALIAASNTRVNVISAKVDALIASLEAGDILASA